MPTRPTRTRTATPSTTGPRCTPTGRTRRSQDTDVDGLHDYAEIDVYGTDPTNFDSDGDLIGDGAEINATGSDPLVADTDGDGLDDGDEGLFGSNPLTADDDARRPHRPAGAGRRH